MLTTNMALGGQVMLTVVWAGAALAVVAAIAVLVLVVAVAISDRVARAVCLPRVYHRATEHDQEVAR